MFKNGKPKILKVLYVQSLVLVSLDIILKLMIHYDIAHFTIKGAIKGKYSIPDYFTYI